MWGCGWFGGMIFCLFWLIFWVDCSKYFEGVVMVVKGGLFVLVYDIVVMELFLLVDELL